MDVNFCWEKILVFQPHANIRARGAQGGILRGFRIRAIVNDFPVFKRDDPAPEFISDVDVVGHDQDQRLL